MREIKNIQLVKFKCDSCGAETGWRPQQNSEDNIAGVHPFPYVEGWTYLHELILKLSSSHSINLSRMHFCNESCFKAKVQAEIDKANTLIKRRNN